LFGNPADVYVLQASPDLHQWTAIATNEAGPDGVVTFTDPQAGSLAQRFYRGVRGGVTLASIRPDRILVRPKAGVNLSVLQSTLGLTTVKTLPALGNLQILRVPAGAAVPTVLATLAQSGLVQYAEPDYLVRALRTPHDVHFQDGSLWNFHNTGQAGGVPDADIDATEAWDTITDASDVIVAVIDTGVRYTHEDLAANMWVNPGEVPGNGADDDGSGYIDDVHGINTLTGTGDPNDDHFLGHGTHVAGTIGALGDNGVGVAGVAWRVQLMALKFIDTLGDGSISDAIICIDYARAHGADIINASWGSPAFTSQALRDAIASARDAGIIFAAAAGNGGDDNVGDDNDVVPMYPASYDLDNIIAVAATTRSDDLADFSNFGATTVHLGAPGSPIGSCLNTSDSAYGGLDGTSMAAANVTGVAALLRAHYPNESYQQIINRILQGVDPLPALAGRTITGGRLNAQKALGTTPVPDTPVVTVTATEATASEAGEPGAFTVGRSGETGSPLTVNYTLGGTAQNGGDYETLPGSVTIPAGVSSANVIITPIDDSTVEGNETVILTLSANAAYTVGSPGNATVTITDNDEGSPSDLPLVWLSVAKPDASETGPDPGTIRFHRTGDVSEPIQVNWTFSGTAANGADFGYFDDGEFKPLPNGSPFPADQSEADLIITPFDDDLVEGDETVVVTLAPGSDYTIGSPDSGTVMIEDNDEGTPPPTPAVTVTATDANASESGGTGTFTVSRSGSTASALTVNYALNGSAENGTDYENLSGSLTIASGSSSATVTVAPIDDTVVEGDETVVLTLSANAAYTVGSPGSATVTIADDEEEPPPPLPTVTVAATDANASESGGTGTFTVSRNGSTTSSLTVNYAMNGSADNGTDYETLPGSVTFASGSSSASITLTPIDDSTVEGDETVVLTLSDNSAYAVGSPGSATVTIVDNDEEPPPPLPTVTVAATDANASESSGTGTFTVSRAGSTSLSLTVNYTVNGSAQNGTDYENLSGSVTIASGSSSASVTVTAIDDSEEENSETVVLTLSASSAYEVGSPSSATVTIADNDEPPPPPLPTVTVTASDANASESGGTGTFTISRSGSTATSLSVNYSMSGSAQNGSDYQNLSGSTTISAGSSSANITVTPIDDSADENNETVVLTLSASSAYEVSSPSSATVTIADNDEPPPALVADFTASPLLGIIPLVVEFTDTSTGNPVSWNWNFGDGSSSTARHPTHIYLIPGDYTATLTVQNSAGATSNKSVVIRVRLL
jgi:subtilisin family serine protease